MAAVVPADGKDASDPAWPLASGAASDTQRLRPGERVAVMSMLSSRAEAVLCGDKRIEIRKHRLAPDVQRVAMYAVRPVQMVVGEFAVERCVTARPFEIWDLFKDELWESPRWFVQYTANADRVTAIVIGDSRRYQKHWSLSLVNPDSRPPQSFYYRSASHLDDALRRSCGEATADA